MFSANASTSGVPGEPYFKYTTLLLSGNSTTPTFINDASTNTYQLTIVGDTRPNSFNPFTPTYYSNYFDGTGDYLTVPSNVALTTGSGAFTVEAWIYITGTQTQTYGHQIVGTYAAVANGWALVINRSTGGNGIAWANGSPTDIKVSYNTYLNTGLWYHIAVVRTSTATNGTKIYLDGLLVATGTDATNDTVLQTLYIGSQGASNCFFPGLISNLRIVKGTAVYTTNFTPPTAPLGVTQDAFAVVGTVAPPTVEALVVAGGGGGGMDMGGGGGGGGLLYSTAISITNNTIYPVSVGRGGFGGPAANGARGDGVFNGSAHQYSYGGSNGANSVFSTLTAIGGGYGGSSYHGYTPNNGYGAAGGSGGGASAYSDGSTGRQGSGTAGPPIQGYAGGPAAGQYYGGGGGGAGGVGIGSGLTPHGGPGVANNILGTTYFWGGGGGGAAYSAGNGGNGGLGGGGGGAIGPTVGGLGDSNGINPGRNGTAGGNNAAVNVPGGDAGANTGGGGGGGSHYNNTNRGGEGGAGIVVIKYASTYSAASIVLGNPTITTTGGNRIYKFTSTGTIFFGDINVNAVTTGTSLLTCRGRQFIDESPNAFTITKAGDVAIKSFNPFSPVSTYANYGSAYFDGSGDYISVPSTLGFDVSGGQAFTIEFWWYPTTLAPQYQEIVTKGNGIQIYTIYTALNFALSLNNTTSYFLTAAGGTLIPNYWNHIALVRNGNNYYGCLNGVVTLLGTSASSPVTGTDPLTIGSFNAGQYPTSGFITNVRMVKGTGLYTSGPFALPTAPLTAIAGTSLLTCQTNQPASNSMFVDESTNALVLARAGNATQGGFNPYGEVWSNYFNGSDSYLSMAGNNVFNFAATDWTVEAWVYLNALPTSDAWPTNYSQHMVLAATGTPSTGDGFNCIIGQTKLMIQSNDVQYAGTAHGLTASIWNHLAYTRSGNTIYFYVNGVAKGSVAFTGSVGTGSTTYIGCETAQGAFFNGYISNLRVVKNLAVYTGNFSLPTTPLGISQSSGGNVATVLSPGLVAGAPPSVTAYAWGGGGGGGGPGGWSYGARGGGGGAANGVMPLTNITYYITVGGGGPVNPAPGAGAVGGGGTASSGSDNRYGSGGGGYSGIFNSGASTQASAILIAGGGGGGGSSRAGEGNVGGAGGGLTGQDGVAPYDGLTAYRGRGGTQTAAGVDASCNSANAAGGQGALQGGNVRLNSYGGQGGGGYWGGSAGGYAESNTMGGGGGGSSYISPSFITTGTLTAGTLITPGDSANALRGTAGNAGAVAGAGVAGAVVIQYSSTFSAASSVTGSPTVTVSGGFRTYTFASAGTISFVNSTATSLLICQTNKFIDNSPNAYILTRNGGTAVQRFSPFTPIIPAIDNYYSSYFDGTDDCFIADSNPVLAFKTNDFTVEGWYYTTASADQGLWDNRASSSSTTGFGCRLLTSSNTLRIIFYNTSLFTTTQAITLNQWNHIAIVRVSGVITAYLNGVEMNGGRFGASGNATDTNMRVGKLIDAGFGYNGYISGFRVVNGTAVYNDTFTPPALPPTAIKNTVLLVNGKKGSLNDSTAITDVETVGDAKLITNNGPFAGSYYSNYFSGSGDYISSSITALGTGDFTIEFWVYPLVLNNASQLGWFQISATSGGLQTSYTNGVVLYNNGSGYFTINVGGTTITSTYSILVNSWMHIAITRTSGTCNLYVNGTSVVTPASASASLSGTYLAIGGYYSTSYLSNAYISNFRIVKGTAVYTGAFTPPTAPLTASQSAGTNITALTDATLIANAPPAVEVSAWGGGGGAGGTGGGTFCYGGGGGFARSTVTIALAAYTVAVGNGGAIGDQGCVTGTGGVGGTNGSGIGTGGNGTAAGTSPCSGTGGGGGAASFFMRSTTILVAGGGGGGAGGTESGENGTGQGGAGGQNGNAGAGSGATGGTSGGTGSFNGQSGTVIGGDHSGSGGGGGGYYGGTAGINPGNDAVSGGGGGGGGNYGTTSTAGVYQLRANSTDSLLTGYTTYATGGGTGSAGGKGIIFVRYADTYAAANTTGSPIVTVAGGFRTYAFTATGTINFATTASVSVLTCQKNDFIDSSFNATTITRNGAPAVRTLNPFFQTNNGSTIYLDGTGDNLVLNNTRALGGGDFTVETWLYPTLTYSATYAGILDSRTSGNGAGLIYFGYNGTANTIGWLENSTYLVTALVTQNAWQHVAVVRASGLLKIYINGVPTGGAANTTSLTTPFKFVGKSYDNYYLNGYLFDLRITAGVARYPAPFTPPIIPYLTQ